ncbi:MAG: diadenylate cyclase CdaA [Clostridia bacterium]|nr:diadenylate cyclase CdaA [Clostridia bacterium]
MAAFFNDVWNSVVGFFSTVNIFTSLLDILIVGLLIYALFSLVRDSRAEQLVKGLLVFLLVYVLAALLDLKTLSSIMNVLVANGLILLAVVFQPELRRALEKAGRTKVGQSLGSLRGAGSGAEDNARTSRAISAVCDGLELLQRQKMGALIIFERETPLGEILRTGTELDAEPSAELIGNLFFNKSPLHDGAVVIRGGRVLAAACILPLAETPLGSEVGTRHRVAVGMSENSDAVVVVLSEESGIVSLAVSGVLKRNYSFDSLRTALENMLLTDPDDNIRRWLQRRKKK